MKSVSMVKNNRPFVSEKDVDLSYLADKKRLRKKG